MMTIARLHELFDADPQRAALGFEGRCHDCGRPVAVAVDLTPEGFAISGGAVYEPEPEKFYNKCEECFRKDPHLSGYRRCEVYSRVVGYLRPVSQWNEGKQAEYGQRKAYRMDGA
jgi:ribosomal protein S14